MKYNIKGVYTWTGFWDHCDASVWQLPHNTQHTAL